MEAIATLQARSFTREEAMDIVSKATSTPFLIKLWSILENPDFAHAVAWISDTEFTIIDIHALERDVLHHFFRSERFGTFQRQLNYFSFRKIGKTSYSHDLFNRTSPQNVLQIKRKTNTGNLMKNRKAAAARKKREEEVDITLVMQKTLAPRVVSPTTVVSRPQIVSVKPHQFFQYDHDPQLKPVTPMTPFFDCLGLAAEKPTLAHNYSFSSLKDRTSFPLISDLEEFERGLDWAQGGKISRAA